ncbi:MAG: hypothetical protein ACLPYS_01960 [Vulcanimicrobiaceae bacterium]
MRRLAWILCAAAIVAAATPANAQPRGGEAHSAPAQRSAAPRAAAPQIAPQRPAGTPQTARGGGFQLNRDLAGPPPHAAAPPVAAPPRAVAPNVRGQAPQTGFQARGGSNGGQVSIQNNPAHRFSPNPGGRRINNPAFHGGAWGWNRGQEWNPAPTYWGGGFWGALAFSAAAALFGELVYSGQNYESYAVYPDSPGATLLANYQLQQTPCGPPDLVVIWGPDNSLICAIPNGTVGPGEYDVDPSTLTLESEG